VAGSTDEAARALSQVKRLVRTNYSNPPTHGGDIVARVLNTPELRAQWEREVGAMRERIKQMRKALADGVQKRVPGADWSFVMRQRGLFSYTGLTKAQVERLRTEFSIYAIDTGRVCVAALNSGNIDHVAEAIAKVIR
jgi:aromatic-amino-acid transaminase